MDVPCARGMRVRSACYLRRVGRHTKMPGTEREGLAGLYQSEKHVYAPLNQGLMLDSVQRPYTIGWSLEKEHNTTA